MQKIIDQINNSRVYEITQPTKLELSKNLSAKFKNNIYLKREDRTEIHTFKIRGAYQKISSLSAAELSQGIITSSAGNHAQGVALAAKKLGIKAIVVMMVNAPKIKVDAVKSYGAKVIFHGETYNDAYDYAQKLAFEQNLVFVSPYNDEHVIAGQGTIAKEIISDLAKVDIIFVPVGGGGLISGIAVFIKHYYPQIKIISVEPIDTPTLHNSLQQNERIILNEVGIFADGVAVKQIGKIPFDLLSQNLVDECILVSNDEICAGIKDIYNDTRSIAEPSGALALAGVKKYIENNTIKNQNLVAIISGGNINFEKLRFVAERAEIGENNEAIFAAKIDEQDGSFLDFCKHLNNHAITEFSYRFANKNEAHIFVGLALNSSKKIDLLQQLNTKFAVNDLSNNSIAKTHIRYMVGGRAMVKDEVLYRFEFPERKNALLNFLAEVSSKWNITLFHYRNYGSAYSSVLVAFQAQNIAELEKSLDKINYIYHNETANEAYQYFL